MAGIIVAGVDPDGTPSVYAVPLGGSLHKKPFTIGGSGSTYIYGYCDSVFKDNMTKDEAIEFTKNGEIHSFFLKKKHVLDDSPIDSHLTGHVP